MRCSTSPSFLLPISRSRSEHESALPLHLLLPGNPSTFHRQNASGAVRGRKEKARDKYEMIDEEPELGLVSCPMRRPVEREGEEQHIGCGQEGGFRETCPGKETRDKSELKQCREPSQKAAQRETR